ncbi:Vitamin B12 import ATP-binding protein BtuD [Firmicutes bacterium ASF500]|nr:Vitamin B12 import ATP-binding protein BtuD [Firmicutes bacterium ASF500]
MALSVDIRKKLGKFQLQVQFEAGDERLALLGASGCGKSLTLRCVAGIVRPDAGKIVLDGVTLFDSAAGVDLPPQRRRVGYLFQQYALFPNMTVRQNIAAAVRDRAAQEETVSTLLRRFRLEELAGLKPGQLSGGQQQRTALARILASQPQVLLLDEPFSALDSYLKSQLELELMETLDQFPGTVLWVSHDRGEVFRSCQRVCVIDGGQSQPVQDLSQLFHAPGTEAAARLSGCKNFADALPRGDEVYLPAWDLTLRCGRPVPPDTVRAGVRARFIRPAGGPGENTFPCAVARVVEDVFSTIVILRPEGSAPDAPPLRMELDKMAWRALPDRERLTVQIAPRDILLFRH